MLVNERLEDCNLNIQCQYVTKSQIPAENKYFLAAVVQPVYYFFSIHGEGRCWQTSQFGV